MRTLIAYYSQTGTTRAVAEALARELSADVEEIRCGRYRAGFLGYVKAAYDSWSGRLPAIEPPLRDPSGYDLVVVGGPVWMMHAATPVRAFLRERAGRLPALALFLTYSGSPTDKALREMEASAGSAAKAAVALRDVDVRAGKHKPAVAAFAAKLARDGAA
jgi:hypothetical protein